MGKAWQHDTLDGLWGIEGNIEGSIKLCYCLFEIELLCISFLVSNWDNITSLCKKGSLGIEALFLCLFFTDGRTESRVSLEVTS